MTEDTLKTCEYCNTELTHARGFWGFTIEANNKVEFHYYCSEGHMKQDLEGDKFKITWEELLVAPKYTIGGKVETGTFVKGGQNGGHTK